MPLIERIQLLTEFALGHEFPLLEWHQRLRGWPLVSIGHLHSIVHTLEFHLGLAWPRLRTNVGSRLRVCLAFVVWPLVCCALHRLATWRQRGRGPARSGHGLWLCLTHTGQSIHTARYGIFLNRHLQSPLSFHGHYRVRALAAPMFVIASPVLPPACSSYRYPWQVAGIPLPIFAETLRSCALSLR